MKNYIFLIFVLMSVSSIRATNLAHYEMEYHENITEEPLNEINQKDSKEKNPFENIINMKGIDVVYISKAMLGMMPNMVNMPGVNIGNVAGKLESMYIISSETKPMSLFLKQTVDKLVKEGSYETLMLVKDDESTTNFYLKTDNNKRNSEILMFTQEDSEVSIIRFIGAFTVKDIQDLTKK